MFRSETLDGFEAYMFSLSGEYLTRLYGLLDFYLLFEYYAIKFYCETWSANEVF